MSSLFYNQPVILNFAAAIDLLPVRLLSSFDLPGTKASYKK